MCPLPTNLNVVVVVVYFVVAVVGYSTLYTRTRDIFVHLPVLNGSLVLFTYVGIMSPRIIERPIIAMFLEEDMLIS